MTVTPQIKSLQKLVNSRTFDLREEEILKLAENDLGIFNVVRGLTTEAFSTIVYNNTQDNFDYRIIYIVRTKENKLEGFYLKLQPFLKKRNELIICFTSEICKRYNRSNYIEIFNTYQHQQRTIFEKLDYWTYGDELGKAANGRNGIIAVKGVRGFLYVPVVEESEPVAKPITDTIKKRKEKTNNIPHVYIMHNTRNQYYKIGRSTDLVYRERTLQSEEPEIVLIEKWVAPPSAETMLHQKFKDKKTRGEWYALTEDDLNVIREVMAQLFKTIK